MIGRNLFILIGLATLSILNLVPVNAQEIIIPVNQTEPCFLNYTAGADMWQQCGIEDDFIRFALAPFEWVTGGYFSMIVVSLLVVLSYIKYHKAVLRVLIVIFFLPVSAALFPDVFLIWAILMVGLLIGILVWYVYIKQTKEY